MVLNRGDSLLGLLDYRVDHSSLCDPKCKYQLWLVLSSVGMTNAHIFSNGTF